MKGRGSNDRMSLWLAISQPENLRLTSRAAATVSRPSEENYEMINLGGDQIHVADREIDLQGGEKRYGKMRIIFL